MLIVIFWFCMLFVFYTYAGYPLLLLIKSKYFVQKINKKRPLQWPGVSIVIAAKNEERIVGDRIKNICMQDYVGPLEIVIVSDGSSDDTCSIVKGVERKINIQGIVSSSIIEVSLIELTSSIGKAAALNEGILLASNDIIVFADCRQSFSKGAIGELVSNFSDSQVGAVSGELVVGNTNDSDIAEQMGIYWHYEKKIRKMESMTGSVVGATGAIYAIRRCLYCPLPKGTVLDDVLTPLNIIFQGYRVVFDSTAIAFDTVSKNVSKEWRRKVRTLGGNWQLLALSPSSLHPSKNPIFFRFISHKIFRLLVPYALVVLFFSSLLIDGQLYRLFFYVQLMVYMLAILAFWIPSLQQIKVVKIVCFFVMLNTAAVVGLYKWTRQRNNISWK